MKESSLSLTVIVPVFNERYTLREIVVRALAQEGKGVIRSIQLILVDDCSTDGSRDLVQQLADEHPQIQAVYQSQNMGKGAAVRAGIALATGEVTLFQDADLEYDPEDYHRLLDPFAEGIADVVYGSRFLVWKHRRVLYFWHSIMNHFLTTLSNLFTDLNLSDIETCYKAFRTSILKSIPLRSNRFGLEPEITAKIARRGLRVYEVPISYSGRTYEEGKKITWVDGLEALFLIIKYWLVNDSHEEDGESGILHSMSRARNFNHWMAERIKPDLGDHVLEIGSGLGNLSVEFLPRERLIVSDIAPLYLDALRGRFGKNPLVEIVPLDVQCGKDFQPLQNRVDTVVCLNVLEHLERDEAALKNIYSVLSTGGTAVVLVPRGRALFGSLDEVLGHRRRYEERDFRGMMTRAGFSQVEVSTFNRMAVPGWLFNGKILARRFFGNFQLGMYDRLVPLARLLERLLPWEGLSLIAVGKKK